MVHFNLSKRYASRVEPLIYRRVVLSSTAQAQLFYRTFRGPSSSKTLAFFEQHVRVFILSALSRTRDVAAVLEVCKGIKTLAIWSHKSSEETKKAIASPFLSPTRLSIIAELFFSGQHHFSHPIFQNVTHLEVVCYDNDDWEWDTLSRLQHLTHLSFDSRYFLVPPPSFSQLVKNTISSCPVTLRVFVLWIDSALPGDYEWEDINSIYEGRADSRAVVACEGEPGGEAVIQIQMYRGFPDILKDWAGLSEGRDFWTEAED
jgi:hypothetical protein